MTVIAWDGITVAADRQASYGSLAMVSRKIKVMKDGTAIAFCGMVSTNCAMLEWYQKGCKKDEWPKMQEGDDWSKMIVFHPNKVVYWYEKLPYKVYLREKFGAWGYGADVATGALAAGADAVKAVKIANRYAAECCGMGVDYYRVCKAAPEKLPIEHCRSDLAKYSKKCQGSGVKYGKFNER